MTKEFKRPLVDVGILTETLPDGKKSRKMVVSSDKAGPCVRLTKAPCRVAYHYEVLPKAAATRLEVAQLALELPGFSAEEKAVFNRVIAIEARTNGDTPKGGGKKGKDEDPVKTAAKVVRLDKLKAVAKGNKKSQEPPAATKEPQSADTNTAALEPA